MKTITVDAYAKQLGGVEMSLDTKIPGTLYNPEASTFVEDEEFVLDNPVKVGQINRDGTPRLRQDGEQIIISSWIIDHRAIALGSLLRIDAEGIRINKAPEELIVIDPNEAWDLLQGATVTFTGRKEHKMNVFGKPGVTTMKNVNTFSIELAKKSSKKK